MPPENYFKSVKQQTDSFTSIIFVRRVKKRNDNDSDGNESIVLNAEKNCDNANETIKKKRDEEATALNTKVNKMLG